MTAPGPTATIGDDRTRVVVAPAAGGRIGQITVDGTELLVDHASAPPPRDALSWGCYPMVPWAGRIRDGRFVLPGRIVDLPRTLGPHAIHGVGYTSRWDLVTHTDDTIELGLELPDDVRWPFGGRAHQRIRVVDGDVLLELGVTAADRAFPASIGWHPWFREPDHLEFEPTAMYRRDRDGITVDELVDVPPPPWDDCFVNDRPILVTIAGRTVALTSDCDHWVVFTERPWATCVEPQTGPPDAPNIRPHLLRPGDRLEARFRIHPVG